MKQNACNLRVFCRSESGQDLFYIEIIYDEQTTLYILNYSLNYNLYQHEDLKLLINIVLNKFQTNSERESILYKIVDRIKIIPNINRFYFKENQLNKNGKYLEFYENVINEIIESFDAKEHVLFSTFFNSYFFELMKENVSQLMKQQGSIFSKNEFEKIIQTLSLSIEYVKVFDSNAIYKKAQLISSEILFDLYVVESNMEIKLILIRKR
jgi:hypothetical protein